MLLFLLDFVLDKIIDLITGLLSLIWSNLKLMLSLKMATYLSNEMITFFTRQSVTLGKNAGVKDYEVQTMVSEWCFTIAYTLTILQFAMYVLYINRLTFNVRFIKLAKGAAFLGLLLLLALPWVTLDHVDFMLSMTCMKGFWMDNFTNSTLAELERAVDKLTCSEICPCPANAKMSPDFIKKWGSNFGYFNENSHELTLEKALKLLPDDDLRMYGRTNKHMMTSEE